MTDLTILKRIKRVISENDPSADAYLFGSRARGDNQEHSDWDIVILVDSDKVTNRIEDQFRDGLYDIELDIGQSLSTFIYPKNIWNREMKYSPLHKKVESEGIQL